MIVIIGGVHCKSIYRPFTYPLRFLRLFLIVQVAQVDKDEEETDHQVKTIMSVHLSVCHNYNNNIFQNLQFSWFSFTKYKCFYSKYA